MSKFQEIVSVKFDSQEEFDEIEKISVQYGNKPRYIAYPSNGPIDFRCSGRYRHYYFDRGIFGGCGINVRGKVIAVDELKEYLSQYKYPVLKDSKEMSKKYQILIEDQGHYDFCIYLATKYGVKWQSGDIPRAYTPSHKCPYYLCIDDGILTCHKTDDGDIADISIDGYENLLKEWSKKTKHFTMSNDDIVTIYADKIVVDNKEITKGQIERIYNLVHSPPRVDIHGYLTRFNYKAEEIVIGCKTISFADVNKIYKMMKES